MSSKVLTSCFRFVWNSPRFLATTSSVVVPEPPKKPLNAFLIFSLAKRQEITRGKRNVPHKEVVAQLGIEWQKLSQDNRQVYAEQGQKLMDDFKEQYTKWWNGLSKGQREEFTRLKKEAKENKEYRRLKKQIRIFGKPRRPLSALNFYISKNINKESQNTETSIKEAFKNLTASWKNMTADDKKPYLDMEANDREKHRKEMVAWEAKMRREGHGDFLDHLEVKKPPSKSQKSDETRSVLLGSKKKVK